MFEYRALALLLFITRCVSDYIKSHQVLQSVSPDMCISLLTLWLHCHCDYIKSHQVLVSPPIIWSHTMCSRCHICVHWCTLWHMRTCVLVPTTYHYSGQLCSNYVSGVGCVATPGRESWLGTQTRHTGPEVSRTFRESRAHHKIHGLARWDFTVRTDLHFVHSKMVNIENQDPDQKSYQILCFW